MFVCIYHEEDSLEMMRTPLDSYMMLELTVTMEMETEKTPEAGQSRRRDLV